MSSPHSSSTLASDNPKKQDEFLKSFSGFRPQHSIKLPMNASLIRSQTAFTPSPTDDICKSVCKISLADSSGRALIISQVCFAKIAFTKSVESFESGKSKSRLFSPLLSPERAKKPDLRLKMSS